MSSIENRLRAWGDTGNVFGLDSIGKDCVAGADEIEALRAENEALKQQVEQGKRDAVPEGWKLLKDSSQEERSWPEDFVYENGNYFNTCCRCGRTFMGHKRRPTCKVCFAAPPKQEK